MMCCLLLCTLEVLDVPEVMRRALLFILEVVEGRLCLPEVPVMRRVLLCMLGGRGG